VTAARPVHRGDTAVSACVFGVIATGRGGGIALFGCAVSGFGALVAQIRLFQQHLQERFGDLGVAGAGQHPAVSAVGDPLAPVGFAFASIRLDFAHVGGVVAFICVTVDRGWGASELLLRSPARRGLPVAGVGGAVTCLGGMVARVGFSFPAVQGGPVEGAIHLGKEVCAFTREAFPLVGEAFSLVGEVVPCVGDAGAVLIHRRLPEVAR
jgi:hypothetical protein